MRVPPALCLPESFLPLSLTSFSSIRRSSHPNHACIQKHTVKIIACSTIGPQKCFSRWTSKTNAKSRQKIITYDSFRKRSGRSPSWSEYSFKVSPWSLQSSWRLPTALWNSSISFDKSLMFHSRVLSLYKNETVASWFNVPDLMYRTLERHFTYKYSLSLKAFFEQPSENLFTRSSENNINKTGSEAGQYFHVPWQSLPAIFCEIGLLFTYTRMAKLHL